MTSNNILVINARQRTISITTEEDHVLNLGLGGEEFDSAAVVDEETRQELLPMSAEAAVEYINDPDHEWSAEDIACAQSIIDSFRVDEAKDDFCNSFESRIQELVPDFDYYADGKAQSPWCAPWTWTHADPAEYLPLGMSAEDAGKRWAEKCAPEIAKAVAEELEALKEVE